jgi:hypothetical protein
MGWLCGHCMSHTSDCQACKTKHEFIQLATQSKASSSNSCASSMSWICLVDLARRVRTVTNATKVNMASTPKSGKAHAGTMLDSFLGIATCCASTVSLASYSRGATVPQGLAGAGTGTTGAQGLTVGLTKQHVALQQCPFAQTVPGGTLLNAAGQVK